VGTVHGKSQQDRCRAGIGQAGLGERPVTIKRRALTSEAARAIGLIVNGIEIGKDVRKVLVAEPDAPLHASASAASGIASGINGGGLMSVAALQIRIVPKRMLDRKEAAVYCGRSVKRFEAECPVAPIQFPNGDERYDMRDLDAWLDSLKAGTDDGADAIIARLGK
jgi:hypothetical protein